MESADICRILEDQYFGPNSHEQVEMDLLPKLLMGVKLFVDVGASLGPYSYHASKFLVGGKITCIEADPMRVRRLRELSAEWQNNTGNQFHIIHAAAADQPGKMDFFVTDQNISGALFQHYVPDAQTRESLNWRKLEVEVVTLDDLFRDEDPDLIKIDVEGAEYRVLLGAGEILRRGKSRFLVEVHPWGDEPIKKTPADVFNLFAEFGYDFQRTHRHWHFFKSNHRVKRYLKNRAMVFILNQPALKATLKKSVLALGRLKRGKPSA